MPPKKPRRPVRQQLPEASDYDSEIQVDVPGLETQSVAPVHLPVRTNEELNLCVLRRRDPNIQQVLSVAPFAVVYIFSSISQTWEKTGIEGTLFVCQLIPEQYGEVVTERYSAVVLNRKGLENFSTELRSSADVDITEEYVILQVTEGEGADMGGIFGLWIFSEQGSSTENMRAVNAQIMMECASRSERSRAESSVVADMQISSDMDRVQQGFKEEQMRYPDVSQVQQQDMFDHRHTPQPQLRQAQNVAQNGQSIDLLSLFGKPTAANSHAFGEELHQQYQGGRDQTLHFATQPGYLPHAHPLPSAPTQAQSLLHLFKGGR